VIQIKTLYDHVMPQLPGITTDTVDQKIVEAARDFCSRTRAWRADFDAANTVADQATYDLCVPESQAEAVDVLRLTVNGKLLFDVVEREPDCDTEEPEYDAARPPFRLSDDTTEIELKAAVVPTEAVAGGLVIYGAMQPCLGAKGLPDMFKTRHFEALRLGTLWRCMLMGGRVPWKDVTLGSALYAQYEQLVGHAATFADSNSRRVLRTRKWG
jgi:hypothetical protein